jgi:hypothetical protein
VFTNRSLRRTCNSGKASDWDAITWGAAIGGRTATVPEKAAGCETSVATIGAATSPRGRRGPIANSRNSWCLKERTNLGHASSPKMRRDAAAGLSSFIFGSSGHCFRDPEGPPGAIVENAIALLMFVSVMLGQRWGWVIAFFTAYACGQKS